eukprot:c44286_g1_i1 orf=122-331(+)
MQRMLRRCSSPMVTLQMTNTKKTLFYNYLLLEPIIKCSINCFMEFHLSTAMVHVFTSATKPCFYNVTLE